MRSGDLSLLSSVPGRPRGTMAEKGWNLGGLKALLPRASGERWPSGIMYGGLKCPGLGIRVADWRSGLQESQGLKPGDRVRPSVSWDLDRGGR